jgi:hypothetical protein
MASLQAAEHLSFPLISKEEFVVSMDKVRQILLAGTEFLSLAEAAKHRLLALEIFDVNEAPETLILDGLVATLLKGERTFEASGEYHFELFCYLVANIFHLLNSRERPWLLGKIKQCLQCERHFDSVLFELLVGFTYHHHGCDVDFCDIRPRKRKGSDLEVSKQSNEYAVEVKTVSYSSGRPYDPSLVRIELVRLANYLSSDEKWTDFRAEVNFCGPWNPSREVLQESMDGCLAGLRSGLSFVASHCFTVNINNNDPSAYDRAIRDYVSGKMGPLGTRYNSFFAAGKPRTNGFIGLRSSLGWKFAQAAAATISDSAAQFISSKRQVLWLRLMGLTSLKADPETTLVQLVKVDDQINAANASLHAVLQRAGVGELVCVHLIGTTEFEEAGNNSVQVNMRSAALSPTAKSLALCEEYLENTFDKDKHRRAIQRL